MNLCNIRNTLVACGIAAATLASPVEAKAFCCLFDWCCKPRQTYAPAPVAPVTYAPAPAPVIQQPVLQQQVQYVPQTCYRTVCTNVPVTTMRPVTTTDPCTGCPVTCMRPETTYVQRTQLVPYTTYRPVVTTVAANPCATPAPASTYYQAAPAAPAPGCCGQAAPATTVVPGPAPGSPAPFTAPSPGGPATSVGPETSVPSLPPTGSTSTFAPGSGSTSFRANSSVSTFQQSNTPRTFDPDVSLKPIPDANSSEMMDAPEANNSAPRLLDPNDRTTMNSTSQPWAISPAVVKAGYRPATTVATPVSERVDADGWHAARD